MNHSTVFKDHLFKLLPWKLGSNDSKWTLHLFICSLL